MLGEVCGNFTCQGNEKCCQLQTCDDLCLKNLPDPLTWTWGETCPLDVMFCPLGCPSQGKNKEYLIVMQKLKNLKSFLLITSFYHFPNFQNVLRTSLFVIMVNAFLKISSVMGIQIAMTEVTSLIVQVGLHCLFTIYQDYFLILHW